MSERPAISYSHEANRQHYTMEGARAGIAALFPQRKPASLLDVGCGVGTWLKAALEAGVQTVRGIEGQDVPQEDMHVPKALVTVADLNDPIDLGQRFDVVISLEVAQLLEPECAETFVDTLVRHGEHIFLSAAPPGQGGQQHVNCQWPDYWQALFNMRGYVCSDAIRWRIWDIAAMEGWYRQNMMEARFDPAHAGKESRIKRVIHPAILPSFSGEFIGMLRERIENGGMLWPWYIRAPFKAAVAKLRYKMKR
jgi:SAM-dependent methyltransferase